MPHPTVPNASSRKKADDDATAAKADAAKVPRSKPSVTPPSFPVPLVGSGLTDLPPVDAPSPPASYVQVPAKDFIGHRPSLRESSIADGAAIDLANFDDFTAVLGAAAGNRHAIADAITLAVRWRASRVRAEKWATYCQTQDALAWKKALAAIGKLKPSYRLALAAKPSLASEYRCLTQLLNAPKVEAKKANRTKAKKVKAETKALAKAVALAKKPAPSSP